MVYPDQKSKNLGSTVFEEKGVSEKDVVNNLIIKYCLESEVSQNRQDFLIFKATFAQKQSNIKNQG